MNGLKRVVSKTVAPRSLRTSRTTTKKPRARPPKKPTTVRADTVEVRARGPISAALAASISKLMPVLIFEPLIGAPMSARIKTGGSLIGLPVDVVDPRASYAQNVAAVEAGGVPRFPLLTPIERGHESRFAGEVQRDVEHFVEGAEILAKDDDLGTMVYEVDAMKRLYGPYGTGLRAANEAERKVRAEANHALHPTATLVARLAFLKRLDELAKLPEGDPRRTVFATSGGVAAGKGDMDEAVKLQFGGFPFGAMWDAAGESDGLENAWVLAATQARGLKAVFAFASNDPTEVFVHVLERGHHLGRYVDLVTFASSYLTGTKNMRAFLDSPEYRAASANGSATTVAMFMGKYDPRAQKDPSFPHYPQARLLGDHGVVRSADLPAMPDAKTMMASATATLEAETNRLRAAGLDPAPMLMGTLGTAEKFARAGLLEQS